MILTLKLQVLGVLKKPAPGKDFPVSEAYFGELGETMRATEVVGEPLSTHVSVYHSGRSDEEKIVEKPPQKPEGAKITETLREKFGGFFKKGAAHLDYPSSEPYEGPSSTTLRADEVEAEPINNLVAAYSSGRSDELPAVSIPIEEVKFAEEPVVTEKVYFFILFICFGFLNKKRLNFSLKARKFKKSSGQF